MKLMKLARGPVALVALATAVGTLTACSGIGSSSGGGGGGSGGSVTLSYLVDNSDAAVKSANAMATAFHAANPTITISVQTRPQGSDGDNAVKTKLSTGDMADVFAYNNGSLLQALKPATNLVPVSDQPWASDLDKVFVSSTTVDGKLYGAPGGTAFGGGVLYNIPIFKRLNLQVPQTWSDFLKDAQTIKAAGIDPIIQTYAASSTWTSQLFVLGDYHNVEAQVPNFAAQYTAGKMKYANTPAALAGFQHIDQARPYFNKDYRSADLNTGLADVANGKGAMYPQLGASAQGISTIAPGKSNDVGFFALPGDDAATNGMTVWSPGGVYIPKSTKGAKLDAAKKFLAYYASSAGCDTETQAEPPEGPYMVKSCALPSTVSQVAKDTQTYFKDSKATVALEFESPIKGPNLEQICIEVGTGQASASKGASLYDDDVKKEAQQLGLPGWS
jgi:raffinose/stachyose/melibiose transport system substrate-binding protein